MTHLVRNAVAHGLESESERVAAGKSPVGTLWASAAHEGDRLLITVEDDGAGMDLERVVVRARALGLDHGDLSPEELVFLPGLSTRETSDGLAGRGVGLDAARAYLREVGYEIRFVTGRGQGTKFFHEPRDP